MIVLWARWIVLLCPSRGPSAPVIYSQAQGYRSVPAARAIVTTCPDASPAGPGAQNALHAAVFQSSEMVEMLLEWRPGLADEVDGGGSTALHYAASDGQRSVVRAILRAAPPATVYRKDSSGGLSAIHVAARMGHRRVVEELLRSRPDAGELRDDRGGTFLHAAAEAKRDSVVSLAVKDPMLRGLLGAPDRDGNTPLHVAVTAGAPGVVHALLRKGKVPADALNGDGDTPFDLAKKSASFFTLVRLVLILIAFGAQTRAQRQDHLKPWSSGDMPKEVERTTDSLSVVAGLVATVAFAAGFNVPGGYDGDGRATLTGARGFQSFLLLNTIAAASSVLTVILLVYGKASRSAGSWKVFVSALRWLGVSLYSLMLGFNAVLVAMSTGNNSNRWFLRGTNAGILVFIIKTSAWIDPAASSLTTTVKALCRGRYQARQRAIIKRQYPFAGSSAPTLLWFSAIGLLSAFIVGRVNGVSMAVNGEDDRD
ncbi:hypothetical protein ACP4OV_014657 [Aristida adscensionis]